VRLLRLKELRLISSLKASH